MKYKKLELLSEKANNCTKCPELVVSRNKVVFGEGNPDAEILLLGEAAGSDENQQGRPFVGKSGKLLDNIIKACGWKREDLYICNTVCCRPPQNRIPKKEELNNCSMFLDLQIETVNPKYIVCLGSVASNALIGLSTSQARGKWHSYKHYKVLVIWHPSYLLRNPDKKKEVWGDLQLLLCDMRQP